MAVTVHQIVDEIIAELPLKDRIALAKLDEEKVHMLETIMGLYVQKKLDEWVLSQELFGSCRNYAEQESLKTSNAPSIIVRLLWKRLRETHSLRVLK